jgi:hypothetical protein
MEVTAAGPAQANDRSVIDFSTVQCAARSRQQHDAPAQKNAKGGRIYACRGGFARLHPVVLPGGREGDQSSHPAGAVDMQLESQLRHCQERVSATKQSWPRDVPRNCFASLATTRDG